MTTGRINQIASVFSFFSSTLASRPFPRVGQTRSGVPRVAFLCVGRFAMSSSFVSGGPTDFLRLLRSAPRRFPPVSLSPARRPVPPPRCAGEVGGGTSLVRSPPASSLSRGQTVQDRLGVLPSKGSTRPTRNRSRDRVSVSQVWPACRRLSPHGRAGAQMPFRGDGRDDGNDRVFGGSGRASGRSVSRSTGFGTRLPPSFPALPSLLLAPASSPSVVAPSPLT